MAWIESHQGLAKHPKTLKLARKLNIHIAQAIGHLHLFWWWAMEYAQDGDLSHCDPEDIAIAADWPGDARLFVESLVESGFVDRGSDGSLSIHDWHDYAGKLLERRKADAERKRKEREKKDVQKESNGHPADAQRTSNVTIPKPIPLPETNKSTTNTHVREENQDDDYPHAVDEAFRRVFNLNIIPPIYTAFLAKIIPEFGEKYAIELILEAGESARGQPNLRYMQQIHEGWVRNGIRSRVEAKRLRDEQKTAPPVDRRRNQFELLNQLEKEFEAYDTG